MKKIVLGLVVGFLGLSSTFSYDYTAEDTKIIEIVTQMIAVQDAVNLNTVGKILFAATSRFEKDSRKDRFANKLYANYKIISEAQKKGDFNDVLLDLFGDDDGTVVNTATPTTPVTTKTSADAIGIQPTPIAKATTTVPVIKPSVVIPSSSVLKEMSPAQFTQLKTYVPAGELNNEVLLIEFTDLQCPFCNRFEQAGTLQAVDDQYQTVGHTSLAFPLSFHKNAKKAAEMLNCVEESEGASIAKKYKTAVMNTGLSTAENITATLDEIISDAGTIAELVKCMDDGDMTDLVEDQMTFGQGLGVTGTPGTIALHIPTMQYMKISGAVPEASILEVVDAMLEKERSYFEVKAPTPSNPGGGGVVTADEKAYEEFLEGAYVQGKQDAKFSVIEFSDFECPFCQRHETNGTLDEVLEKYGDEVNVIFGHFPLGFHDNAEKAAQAAECAGEIGGKEMFFDFKKTLFEIGGKVSTAEVAEAAGVVGLDLDELTACIDSGKFAEKVADQMTFGRSLGVTGTPGNVVIDNQSLKTIKISGAVPFASFDKVLSELVDGEYVYAPAQVAVKAPTISLEEDAYEAFLETVIKKGNPEAPVTIIEFSDFQCPFCQRHANNGTLDTVLEKYPDDVNLVFAHFPLSFHANAEDAGQALECARKLDGVEGYFAFKKAYFAAGGDSNLDIAKVAAESVGIDGDVLIACVESDEFEAKVAEDMAFGRSLGVTGTPGNVVIDNATLETTKISGAVPASSFDATIKAILQ